MPKSFELYLRVKEADEADFDKPIIRIHKKDKPGEIDWGDLINVSLDNKNWVTCKLQPSGSIGAGKIYIGIRLRGLLNKNTVALQIAKIEIPCRFYIRKASPWKTFIYVTSGIITLTAIAFLVYWLISAAD